MLDKKVIVVGDACIDIHIKLSDYLNENFSKQMPFQASLGGTIANTATSLSRLGAKVSFCGTVGNDYTGKQILKKLKENNIDTSLTIVDDNLNTVNVFALIDDSGERHLWGYPRENVAYSQLDLKQLDLNLIKQATWIHSSGMTLLADGSAQKSIQELFKIAYKNNIPTSFDFNTRVSDKKLLNPKALEAIENLLPYVNYLLGSFEEFKCFYPDDDINNCLKYIGSQHKACIARNGKEGYLCLSNGKIISGKAYEVKVLDSTGAGDYFDAGFIYAMLNGMDVIDACVYGNKVAAYKISNSDQIEADKINTFMKEK